MSEALKIVQEYFPEVKRVVDAKEPIVVEVTPADTRSAKVRNHQACAMAVACKRAEGADGVIVSMSMAYVINGPLATRYRLPQSVIREVVSFDREAGFDLGEYQLSPPVPTGKLGAVRGSNGKHTGEKKKIKRVHHTGGVRTVLGSHEPKRKKAA